MTEPYSAERECNTSPEYAASPNAGVQKNTTARNFFIALCSTRNRTARWNRVWSLHNAKPRPTRALCARSPARLRYNVCLLFPANCAGPHGKGTMPTDVVMPQMGESIFEGTITKWLKKPGDKIQRDEPLFEISTDKVDAEIPAPASGVLQEIKVSEGNTVQVNTVVGVIGDG